MTEAVFDEAELKQYAAELAARWRPPMAIWLVGDLGAGKTTFARALIHSLGHDGPVKSPTYGLMEHYELSSCSVLHLDLYRIEDPEELEYLGIKDLFDENTLLLVEWPERAPAALPPADVVLRFSHQGSCRRLELRD